MNEKPLSEDEKWNSMSIGEKFMVIFIVVIILLALTGLAVLVTPLLMTR